MRINLEFDNMMDNVLALNSKTRLSVPFPGTDPVKIQHKLHLCFQHMWILHWIQLRFGCRSMWLTAETMFKRRKSCENEFQSHTVLVNIVCSGKWMGLGKLLWTFRLPSSQKHRPGLLAKPHWWKLHWVSTRNALSQIKGGHPGCFFCVYKNLLWLDSILYNLSFLLPGTQICCFSNLSSRSIVGLGIAFFWIRVCVCLCVLSPYCCDWSDQLSGWSRCKVQTRHPLTGIPYRWVPLYSNVFKKKMRFIQTVLKITVKQLYLSCDELHWEFAYIEGFLLVFFFSN